MKIILISVIIICYYGREVPACQVWRGKAETLEGSFDDKKPNEYQTADYGTLYRNTITNIICDKFGAERKHRNSGSILIFDLEKLVKVGKIYDLETVIQTKVTEYEGDSGDGSDGYTEGMDSSKQNNDVSPPTTAISPIFGVNLSTNLVLVEIVEIVEIFSVYFLECFYQKKFLQSSLPVITSQR